MRLLSFAPIAALVLTGLVYSVQPSEATQRPMTPATADEICAPFLVADDAEYERRRYRGSGTVASAPPPPAPPPPPPPPPSQAADGSIVVSGSRVASPNREQSMPVQAVGGIASHSVNRAAVMPQNRERYDGEAVASIMAVADEPVSTFAVDVDTGSYANVRRFLNQGRVPPQAAVRTEEMVNYFRYDYARPADRTRPFSITTDMATTPWNENTRLLRIGLRGYDIERGERPAANLVFLVDVSGSMHSRNKLPLVQCSMAMMAEQLNPRDRVSIVTYAGSTKTILTGSNDRDEIIAALGRLRSGGSTAGAAGISLAYDAARANMIEGGINRIILATDGDFNVGTTNRDQLIEMVEREREAGISLTTLGYGTGNYNEAMMEQIANHGNGNYAYIDSAMEAHRALVQELSSTLFTIAADVKIQIEFNPMHVREYRLIGYENRLLAEEDFDNDTVDAGEIGAGHQVTALYEIVPAGSRGWLPERRYSGNRPEARGGEGAELAHLRLRYKLPGEDESRLIEQPIGRSAMLNARAPSGDMAFVTAVAAFGQRLRGDTYLGEFDFADIRRLAQTGGRTSDYWRGEFVTLTELAEARSAPGGTREGGSR
ncbi:VWA domain-containing protein [Parasphingopyxis sp.]|uniref:vWA domain-containing protein n=1 Tax=Parasphingopyxis sp. TaxID=1920299 RepID=UPI002629D0E1|nr:VWA domain-containing protein [Parasphingopyxis sp.]